MFKFKDLYVHLAPEHAPEMAAPAAPEMLAPGGPAGAPWGLLAIWGGGPFIEVCKPGAPSASTLVCDPTFINHALQVMGGGPDGAPLALKDYLKSTLEKAVQEPQNMHDMRELEQLEGKLRGALQEVLDRKDEVKSKAAAAAK